MSKSTATSAWQDTDAQQPAELWQQALSLLRGQMDAATFTYLLQGSHLIEGSDSTWKLGVRPHAVEWLVHRANPVIERTVQTLTGRQITVEYVPVEAPPPPAPAESAPEPAPVGSAREPAAASAPRRAAARPEPTPPSAFACLLAFDPNSASGGGFWKMGHYANWFWAAYLGTVPWRVYELVVSGDKRADKTEWTPPRRYSISELARAVASGRQGRPNRDQIRGRYRRIRGERVWRPGAFDRLTREGVARIEWHDGSVHWRPWQPGGSCRPGKSGIRIVYRISVVTSLPLLSPRQVACLPAENQVAHERYMADRAQDLAAWEQIALHTLAGIDAESAALAPGRQ
jgi:hypothetical protein